MKSLAILLLVLCCGILPATEDDLRQVRTLLNQGLYDAAESLYNEKIQQPDIVEPDKIRLAAELVRSNSQRLLLEPAQRPRIIRLIETLESMWLASTAPSTSPDGVLTKIAFRLQCAMAYRSLGDYQRLEADTVSATNKRNAQQQARATLHDSLERLKKCHLELQRVRQKIGINANSSLNQKILALEYSIMMQQGIARKLLAQTLSVEEERKFELRQAAETLSEVAALESTEPVIIQCKIEKAACHRLCGELDQCAEILNQLRSSNLSMEDQLRTDAEWIRYNIVLGNIAEMRRHYATDHAQVNLYPDFSIARLELFLASDASRRIRSETSLVMRLEQTIDRQLGPYWARRARLIIHASGNTDLTSAEMLSMRAERHDQDQQFVESAELYEQAAAKADALQQADNMYRFNRLAARAWDNALKKLPSNASSKQLRDEYQKRLIVLLRTLAVQAPRHPEALQLHLLAIDLQVQVVLSQPEALDDYLELVKEHEEYWHDSPQIQRIRRQTIVLLERQGRIPEAAAVLPLLDAQQLETLTPEIQRLRVRQLDSEGKTQEAVDLLATLLKQRREPATLSLLAGILTRQTDTKSLELALNYWTELEQKVEKDNELWWSIREGHFEVLSKLNRRAEAKKVFETLRILYPDLGGAERKERLFKQFEGD